MGKLEEALEQMKEEKESFEFDTFPWDSLNEEDCWEGLKEECQTDEIYLGPYVRAPFNWSD